MSGTPPSSTFLEDLAAPRPDPGGGAAAAYAALLALALVEKVVQLELGRGNPGEDRHTYWRDELASVRRFHGSFTRLCGEDVLAYQRLARTLGHPLESKHRRLAILGAVDCPHQMLLSVHETLSKILEVGLGCRKHLVGDVLVAVELMGAALQGAYHIACANLPLLQPSRERQDLSEALEADLRAGMHHLTSIRENLTTRLMGASLQQVFVDPCC